MQPALKLQIGNNRAEIGIAASFAIAVYGALHLYRTSFNSHQGIGGSHTTVIMTMDANRY
jgi:hypothetical protein